MCVCVRVCVSGCTKGLQLYKKKIDIVCNCAHIRTDFTMVSNITLISKETDVTDSCQS